MAILLGTWESLLLTFWVIWFSTLYFSFTVAFKELDLNLFRLHPIFHCVHHLFQEGIRQPSKRDSFKNLIVSLAILSQLPSFNHNLFKIHEYHITALEKLRVKYGLYSTNRMGNFIVDGSIWLDNGVNDILLQNKSPRHTRKLIWLPLRKRRF